MSEYQELAEQAVKETAELDSFAYWGDIPIGKTWALTFSKTRDSDLINESNYESILKHLSEKYPNQIETIDCSHWLCGWITHIAVEMLDSDGKVTKIGTEALEIMENLRHNYPIFDESDYSEKQYERQLESIGYCEENSKAIFDWLWDNEQTALEDPDDTGYVCDEAVERAARALGLIEVDPDDMTEDEYAQYLHDQEQEEIRELWNDKRQLRLFG